MVEAHMVKEGMDRREAVADVGHDVGLLKIPCLALPNGEHDPGGMGSEEHRDRVREALAAEPIKVVKLCQGKEAWRAYKLFRRAPSGVGP
jgi:hypothetical protein